MPRKHNYGLAALVLLGAIAHAQQYNTIPYNGRLAVDNEVVIRLSGLDAATRARVLSLLPSGIFQELSPKLGLLQVHLPGETIAALVARFSKSADVKYVEANYVRRTTAVPNDSIYTLLWGMPKISAPSAWDLTTGGTSAVAGVVDTGVDYTHPDLAANIWSAPSAFTVNISNRSITCPAGSHGFNAITFSCDPRDDHYHGTHVSGTIGAAGNNGFGVTGVNWRASIMGLKFLDASGSGVDSDAIKAMEFALQVKAFFATTATPVNLRIMSASWGGAGFSQALLDEINRLNTSDVLLVAAAGNAASNSDISPSYPAGYRAPNIISVAATDSSDTLASFSNYGRTTVHLAAPGVGIYSTVPGAGYSGLSGTSMATPHVSGAALLTLANCPSLNTAGLKSAILNNVDPIPALAAKTTTGGRLNVNNAVRSCVASGAAASFVKVDTATQGNWRGVYGADGYVVVGDQASNPGYVSPAVGGALTYTWASSTPDVRGLQKGSNASDRIAATWYNTTPFTIDLNITDTAQHQIALYCVDWDSTTRRQIVEILDAAGNVLSTQTLTNLNGGVYLVWNVSGHVKIRVSWTGGWNAVASGLFFGAGAGAGAATSSFVKADTATQGNWRGVYGADGYVIVGDQASNPSYVSPAVAGALTYTWTSSTTDVRGLQKGSNASDRIAATWYNTTPFTIDLNITDTLQHQIALYCVDWDSVTRGQTVDILDAAGNVLSTQPLTNFNGGVYLVWNVSGHVKIRMNWIQGWNAVVSGIFFR